MAEAQHIAVGRGTRDTAVSDAPGGGVTALGAKRDYPVYADETIELFEVISVSAGIRGTQVLLAPGDYLRVVDARVAPIGREK